MIDILSEMLEYYSTQSKVTDPREQADLYEDLPADIEGLCRVVQGLVIHGGLAEPVYGLQVPEDRKSEEDIRDVAQLLARVSELDPRPLMMARPLDKRLIGHCRVSAVLFCSMLRAQNVPARVRFGFSAYYAPGFYGDHVAVECWNDAQERWVLVDQDLDNPELDQLLAEKGHPVVIDFDPRDVPRDQFIVAGKAWQMCRAGEIDPAIVGFDPSITGMGYIRGQLLFDLASLNKYEPGEQDTWGIKAVDESALTEDDLELLDRIASLTQSGEADFNQLQVTYFGDPRLRYTQAATDQSPSPQAGAWFD